MTLERITGENLSRKFGLRKWHPSEPDATLKFVLLKSSSGAAYLRIDMGPEHIHSLGRLQEYLTKQGESISNFIRCGGGFVSIYHQNPPEKTRLNFYGDSFVLGKFDKDLLQQVLDEALNKEKFEYHISI